MGGLPSFPAAPGPGPECPAALAARGYALRPATDTDLPALLALYADTRAEEMAGVPWPEDVRRRFLAQQFEFQHRHYVAQYAGADFLVIEREGAVLGRYYLLRTAPDHLVVDIGLVASQRGQGIGRGLIAASQAEAALQGRGMELHVVRSNTRARRLYETLGFAACEGGSDTHLRMRWPAS